MSLIVGLDGCLPAYEARLRSLRAAGDFARAERLLQAADERSPQNSAIVRELGVLAFEQGETEKAISLLEEALSLDPEDGRAALYIAAANERAGQWSEASIRYRRAEALWEVTSAHTPQHAELEVALACRRQATDERRLATLVESRLGKEVASTTPQGRRILFLPMATSGDGAAISLRLGLAALLSADWERTPAPEPVPFAELMAFLKALEIPLDATIGPDLRDRLARLTDARYVVEGRISELNEIVYVAPVFIDLQAEEGLREQRLEYQEFRVGTLLDLEKTLFFRLIAATGTEPTPAQEASLSQFTSRSGVAVLRYGEAMRLLNAGKTAEAEELLSQAVSLDPDFRPARDAQIFRTRCQSAAGEPGPMIDFYETALRAEEDEALRRELLSQATREAGRLGGPEGEGENLSLNRPIGAGSVSVPVSLPR